MKKRPFPIGEEILRKYRRAGLSRKAIAAKLGCSESAVKAALVRHGIKMPSRTDLEPDQRFRRLTVIRKLPHVPGQKSWYECRCDCGTVLNVPRNNLTSDNTGSCGCSHKLRGQSSPLYRGHGEIRKANWTVILRAAASRKLPVEITIEFAWELFVSQGRKCALTGAPISFAVSRRHDTQTASLDRIDSKIGYVSGNVQWVHKDVNRMKQHFTEDYFVDLCRQVVRHTARKRAKAA